MVVVPAGEYKMGSPDWEVGRSDDEGPVHRVTIAEPFAVGMWEWVQDCWNDSYHGAPSDGGAWERCRPEHRRADDSARRTRLTNSAR